MRRGWGRLMIIGLTGVIWSYSIANAEMIFEDNFDGYAAGTPVKNLPGWIAKYNAASDPGNNVIVNNPSKSSPNSAQIYGAHGGCWEADLHRYVNVGSHKVLVFEVEINNSGEAGSGCHKRDGGAGIGHEFWDNGGFGIGQVSFMAADNPGWGEKKGINIGGCHIADTYETNRWYSVKFIMDFNNDKGTWYLDGKWVCEQDLPDYVPEYIPNLITLTSGDGKAWFDNVKLYSIENVCDPSIDIILNDHNLIPGETLTADLRITNDATPDKVDIKVWVEMPDGSLLSIFNVPGKDIPANADVTKRIFSYTCTGAETAGNYRFGGRLIKWIYGEMFCEDIEQFDFKP